jgi:Zn-dependent M28 family amino/carboxypeptidase
VNHAVRFGFWGAEERSVGLKGSMNHLESLSEDQLKDIALYLNFDMIASPNPGYFTYDGDQSLPRGSRGERAWVPEGSAGIERTLVAYLTSAGKPPEDAAFYSSSDYDSFMRAGIPTGWLFTGGSDEQEMSDDQAERWGGEAGQPFDPIYHKKTDTLEHIDRTAMEINGRGVAYVVGLYAQDQGGRNGLPIRDDRTRHVLTNS